MNEEQFKQELHEIRKIVNRRAGGASPATPEEVEMMAYYALQLIHRLATAILESNVAQATQLKEPDPIGQPDGPVIGPPADFYDTGW